jgi:hypothetical protein
MLFLTSNNLLLLDHLLAIQKFLDTTSKFSHVFILFHHQILILLTTPNVVNKGDQQQTPEVVEFDGTKAKASTIKPVNYGLA